MKLKTSLMAVLLMSVSGCSGGGGSGSGDGSPTPPPVIIKPSGHKRILVADNHGDSVGTYDASNPASGMPEIHRSTRGMKLGGLVAHQSTRFIYGYDQDGLITTLNMNHEGKLTVARSQKLEAEILTIAIPASAANVALVSVRKSRIACFKINEASGDMKLASSIPMAGKDVLKIVTHPKLNIAYALNRTSNTIHKITIDPLSGSCMLAATNELPIEIGNKIATMVIEPAGNWAFLLTQAPSAQISSFYLTPSGALAYAQTIPGADGSAFNMAMDPSGKSLWIATNAGDPALQVWSHDLNGKLDAPQLHAIPDITAVNFDATGRLVFVTEYSRSQVHVFDFEPGARSLTPVKTVDILDGPRATLLLNVPQP